MLKQLQRDNVAAFRKLLECLETGHPLALVGSGLVLRAGYPSWDGLIEKLHKHSGIAERVGEARAEFIRRLDDPLFRADVYRKALNGSRSGARRYYNFLRNEFQPDGHSIDDTLRRFARLGFSHFLTTNYDPTLQRALGEGRTEVIEWEADAGKRDEFIASLGVGRRDRCCVVHLHGIWNDPKTIVLTDEDYLNRYVRKEEAKRLLFAIFATKSVVFVGFGLRDPDLMQLLRSVASTFSVQRGRHFALLAHDPNEEDAALVRERLVRKFDITPVFYPLTKNHSLLEKLILALERRDPRLVPDFTKQISSERSARSKGRTAAREEFARTVVSRKPIIDPDDLQKGRWGGRAMVNGRRLSGRVAGNGDWYEVTLIVEALPGSPDFAGPVTFHLHDTFAEPDVGADRETPPESPRKAVLKRYAYGAFTVGADVQGEETELELDLAKLPDAPKAFREA